MKALAVAAAAASSLFLASCAAPGTPPEHRVDSSASSNASTVKKRPTLTLDDQARLADPTSLQLLEDRSQDLAKARKRIEELEAELRQRGHDLERVKDDSKTKSQEKEQLEGLLRDATENERAANEKAISAEIARLKFEQEVLRMKLGNLARENP